MGEPEGLVYVAEALSAAEETALLEQIATLRFDPIVLHGRPARRTARHYGLGYDYASRTPEPGEPLPEWLEPARARAAELAGVAPAELVEALVQHYPPGATIGWHRDAAAIGASSSSCSSAGPGTSSPARRAGRGSTRSRRPRTSGSRSPSERFVARAATASPGRWSRPPSAGLQLVPAGVAR